MGVKIALPPAKCIGCNGTRLQVILSEEDKPFTCTQCNGKETYGITESQVMEIVEALNSGKKFFNTIGDDFTKITGCPYATFGDAISILVKE